MSRRPLSTLLGVAALGLGAALLPAASAGAAEGFTLVIAPNHGVPGTELTANITTPSCEGGSVAITGSYVDVNGDDATTSTVTADQQSSTSWTAALAVPDDAARTSLSELPVTFTATTDCAQPVTEQPVELSGAASFKAAAAPGDLTATATVVVDDLAAAVVTPDTDSVMPGDTFAFTITRCTSDLIGLFFLDGAGNDTEVPATAVTGTAPSFAGSFTVPAGAVEGDAELVAECTQAGEGSGALSISAASVVETPVAAPVAVPVVGIPTVTG